MRRRVEGEIAVDQHRLGATGAAPGEGANAGGQFVQINRLDEVIVGAGIEAGHLLAGGCTGRPQ